MEDRKDSDDEKSDRNRPWWKKRFVSAIPKGKETAHLVILTFVHIKVILLIAVPLCFCRGGEKEFSLIIIAWKYYTLKSRGKQVSNVRKSVMIHDVHCIAD